MFCVLILEKKNTNTHNKVNEINNILVLFGNLKKKKKVNNKSQVYLLDRII